MTTFLRALPRDRREDGTAPRGQVIVMFALFLTSLLGMLGLATDLGFAFVEKRTMQNAADAGALAGARAVAKSLPGAPRSALGEVRAMAGQNRLNAGEPTVTACAYVTDAEQAVGDCAAAAPAAATGVRVSVEETHQTFFIQVLPGAPDAVTTHATATAHVQKLATLPADGPFLVCGVNTHLATGGQMDIMLKSGSTWTVNPSAVGKTFIVHGPQIEKCKSKSSRFKGVADQAPNRPKRAPDWFNYTEGDTAGPVEADVTGPLGCRAGQEVINCVAFLPIAVDTPPEAGNNRQLWTVGFAPFYITSSKSNEHEGRLMAGYIVSGPGEAGWTPGYTGPIVVRLTA